MVLVLLLEKEYLTRMIKQEIKSIIAFSFAKTPYVHFDFSINLISKVKTPAPGIEPRYPCGKQFSRLPQCHYATRACKDKEKELIKFFSGLGGFYLT